MNTLKDRPLSLDEVVAEVEGDALLDAAPECPDCPGHLVEGDLYMECRSCGYVDDDGDWDEQAWDIDRDYEVGR